MNVVLIGFMGVGKSVVGRALADTLSLALYDIDAMVEERGRSIAEIWRTEGEESFRDLEHDAVADACAGFGRVIACGGGASLQLRNYGLLRGAGTIVFLRASADTLRGRIGAGAARPLLADPGAFDALLAERTPVYETQADLIVDVDERAPEDVAREIAEKI